MKTLIKLAVGAAIAGALVNMLVRRRKVNGSRADSLEATPAAPERFTLQEFAGENAECGGGIRGLNS